MCWAANSIWKFMNSYFSGYQRFSPAFGALTIQTSISNFNLLVCNNIFHAGVHILVEMNFTVAFFPSKVWLKNDVSENWIIFVFQHFEHVQSKLTKFIDLWHLMLGFCVILLLFSLSHTHICYISCKSVLYTKIIQWSI